MISLDSRPKKFDSILGQNIIIREFKKRSKTMDFPYYMLFHGPSGTGKSSCAILIGKLLFCKNLTQYEDGHQEPCNECEYCLRINDEKFPIYFEYLDASKMGKEEVKRLDARIELNPFLTKRENRFVIIDEAQLLASSATKGAMLRMLEYNQNKQRHSSFIILCTTDAGSFDAAFKSRLVSYTFKKLNNQIIENQLKTAADSEGMHYIDHNELYTSVIPAIARQSNGNMRSAYQNLERCIMGDIFTISEAEEALELSYKAING